MRKWRPHFSLCVILALFLMVGCATLQNFFAQAPAVFTTTIGGKKITVQLPEEFPNLDKATLFFEGCHAPFLCRQTYDINKESHHRFNFWYTYIDKQPEIFGIVLIPKDGKIRGWLYAKGILVPVTREIFQGKMQEHYFRQFPPPKG